MISLTPILFSLSLISFPLYLTIFIFRGFSSILSIVLSPQHGFSDRVRISSLSEFFHSNAWLGAISSLLGVIGGQALGLVADRSVQ